MKRLGLGDAKAIENLKKKIEEYAQGEQWKLDVVDTARGREYRGIVGSDEEESEVKQEEESEGEIKGKGGDQKKKHQKPKQKEKEQQKGSEEEYFKEEL